VKSKYTPQRTKNIFSVADDKPYTLSRSKIEGFMRCQRCFYLDRKCGTDQPPMFPYTLNLAIDDLLKKEFDQHRLERKPHPYLVEHNIDAIPFSHADLDNWRLNKPGITYHHVPTNFVVMGVIDDVWINPQCELIIVDYKATSVDKEVTLDDRDSYKRQMEIYQWLFRKNGFSVSNTAYFVYCNGDKGKSSFDNALHFKISLLPYKGDDSWIEEALLAIKICLMNDVLPELSPNCDYCAYYKAVTGHIEQNKQNNAD
jgi:hypothetical protein